MFRKWILMILCVLGIFAQDSTFAAKQVKAAAHQKAKSGHKFSSSKKSAKLKQVKKTAKKSSKKGGKKNSRGKKSRKGHASAKEVAADKINRAAPLEMIAQNKEKKRLNDSTHKLVFANTNKEEEGYFASSFSNQKKANFFQTLEGTAAVFKSVSGWEDKKFYILTNELPVGTLVRITSSNLKSICAKVISALPDMSANIKYRLNDAAAAILGITNKTFPISVTY